MATYLVLNPPGSVGKDEEARIIKDGFSLFGLVLPLFFLLLHRLWLASGILAAAGVAASVLAEMSGISAMPLVLWLTSGLYVGLEGNNLRVRALTKKNWDFVDVVMADNLGDAEALYFAETEDARAPVLDGSMHQWSTSPSIDRRVAGGATLGFFDQYGGR